MAAPQKCAARMQSLFATIQPDRPERPAGAVGGASGFASRVDSVFAGLEVKPDEAAAAAAAAAAATWRAGRSAGGATGSAAATQVADESADSQATRMQPATARGNPSGTASASDGRKPGGRSTAGPAGQYCPPHRRGASNSSANAGEASKKRPHPESDRSDAEQRPQQRQRGSQRGGSQSERQQPQPRGLPPQQQAYESRPQGDSSRATAYRGSRDRGSSRDRGRDRGRGRGRGGGSSGPRAARVVQTAERVPHHLQDSRRFKKYSLADVETSERVNTAAAFSFLNTLSSSASPSSSDPQDKATLSSGSGAVKFRPRHKPSQQQQPTLQQSQSSDAPPKRKRRGKLLDEVVVGQQQQASGRGGGRRKMSGRERAIAAGLLRNDDDDGDGDDSSGAAGVRVPPSFSSLAGNDAGAAGAATEKEEEDAQLEADARKAQKRKALGGKGKRGGTARVRVASVALSHLEGGDE